MVWRIALDAPADLSACMAVLDTEEQVRANRFRFAEHRRRFIVAHAAVRCILARHLASTANSLRFAHNPHGKPLLSTPDGSAPVFSLSHSHEMALCALAPPGGELGIDLEWQRDVSHTELAQRFFAPEEATALHALPATEQASGFFTCWTRKEAYIKAKGLGLSLPLASFVVSVNPASPPVLLTSTHDPSDVGRMQFWEVPVPAGYRAVLAYRGPAAMSDFALQNLVLQNFVPDVERGRWC
jgi:4'-phosphopantetheinyl transferase